MVIEFKKSNIEGDVFIYVVFNEGGKVIAIKYPPNPNVLHDTLARAINQLQYSPAIYNGKGVNCIKTFGARFLLSSNIHK